MPTNKIVQDFFAHDPARRGGVNVTLSDLKVDGKLQILTGAADGVPEVGIYSGTTGATIAIFPTGDTSLRQAAQAQVNQPASLRAMMATSPPVPIVPDEGVRVSGGQLLPGTGLRGVAATYFTSTVPGTEKLIDLAPFVSPTKVT